MMRYSDAEVEWIRANYGAGDINDTLDAFEARFGRRPSHSAIYQKAYKLGLVKRRRSGDRGKTVERTVRWTGAADREYTDWMLANDKGHSIAAVVDAFEREFGFRLTRTQVSQFRARFGVGRRGSKGGRPRRPIGYERDSGKGYVLVKMTENAVVPLSKDNWRMKHHVVWERHHGRSVPEGCEIVFADRDSKNFDPANLVAVERRLVGIINCQGLPYCDAESLEAAVAQARLVSAIKDAELRRERPCGVCGRIFVPSARQRGYAKPVQTCPECRSRGLKASGARQPRGTAECAVCGREFAKARCDQRRCPQCIAAAPRAAVKRQRRETA